MELFIYFFLWCPLTTKKLELTKVYKMLILKQKNVAFSN